jgi:hypothetical protein
MKRSPMYVGMTDLEDVPLCPLLYSPPTSSGFSQPATAKTHYYVVVNTDTVSAMANLTAGEYNGDSKELEEDLKGVEPWDFFL